MSKFKIKNYIDKYSDLVSFGSNRYKATHRWFPLVEGYSSELVRRILGEQAIIPNSCLDPFGGVGTTALVCQELGIKCYSIESNPFFYEVSRTKLRSDYSADVFEILLNDFQEYLSQCKLNNKYPDIQTQTLFENPNLKRWIFNKGPSNGIIDITKRITELETSKNQYASIFKVALGSILIDVSNVFRNGKCLSYKHNWQENNFSRKFVHQKFLNYCREIILVDLKTTEIRKSPVHNYVNFFNDDSRNAIRELRDDSIDIVITSPPYLNSRDYTDTYRLELWVLNYINKYEDERKIRKSALTSHVQIQLMESTYPNIKELREYICFLDGLNGKLWNKNIPNMIKGYFFDIEKLLIDLKPKLISGAKLYINVSNSAYYGKICETDIIIGKIAKNLGYELVEIRLARLIKSSPQQVLKEKIRESIIVLKLIK